MSIRNIVDTCLYPLCDGNGTTYQKLVAGCRQQLEQDGCCLLPGFVKSEALEQARQEAVELASEAFQMNHYFAYDDINDDTLSRDLNGLPEDHPRRFKSLTKIRFIARDLISLWNPINQIHNWSDMCFFLQDVMEIAAIYPNECPLSSCVFTVAEAGELQDWHFDGNDFIVTLMLEDSTQGGHFEFVRGLRQPNQDDDFENISKVIYEDYPDVSRPAIKPGTLTLFCDRYSLHRASTVEGSGRRIMAVLSYETELGKTGTDEYLKLFYDRTLSEAVTGHSRSASL